MTRILFFTAIGLFFFSCGWREHPAPDEEPSVNEQELMLGANRQLIERDAELIDGFIRRRNWQMEKTPSGFYYQVYEPGSGAEVKKGDVISLEYKLWLLDGTLCYTSEERGPLVFLVGQGGVETGLEEAVLLLREGDRARLILPPFLAYGLVGDQEKIPPRATIVYDLQLTGIN
jgi:FKBP-type peptidyl-prolyl cis-trans isomerase FkpA